jgi:hypothetical protein
MAEKKKQVKKKLEKKEPKKQDFWGKIGDFVKEAVDCCLE